MEVIEKIAEEINNNNIEKALRLIQENCNQLDGNAEFWNLQGILYINAGENLIAIECLKKAIEIESTYFDAQYNLAQAYELNNMHLNALDIYIGILSIIENNELKEKVMNSIKRIEEILNSKECEIIIKNTENKNIPEFVDDVYSVRHSFAENMVDNDVPLVSIFVLAYNNLEKYTKTCVECILKYTKDIDYELVLVDNGSTDGTFEYFKSVPYSKKRIIRITKNIGAYYGSNMGCYYSRGLYMAVVQNDVYVTKNWLSNMLKCATTDPRVGMITPTSDYISNFQAVNLGYSDFDDMQHKAAKYNISDSRKWEERLRLITLGTLYKKECLDIVGFGDYGFIHDFGDDDLAFRIRRAGYKAILCKDVFVSHAGKFEFKEESLSKGENIFRNKYYGVSPWNDVNNYEYNMMSIANIKENKVGTTKILGVDVLCGTPILELKNKLRNIGSFNTKLYAFSTEAKYWLDLKTICEGEVAVDRPEYILEHFTEDKFDYIVLGKPINNYREPYKLLGDILKLLDDEGQLLLKLSNNYDYTNLVNIIGNNTVSNEEISYQITLESFIECIRKFGGYTEKIIGECHAIDENAKNTLLKSLTNCEMIQNTSNVASRIMIKTYIISIFRNPV